MRTEARLPLAEVAVAARRAPAIAVTPVTDRAGWLARIAAWRQAFAKAPDGDVALYFDDAAEFAAALYASWQSGRTPWLAPDALPETRARLAAHVVVFAGDRADDGDGAITAADAADAAGATDATGATGANAAAALDPDRCRLVLYTSGSTGEPVAIGKSLRQLDAEVAALEARFGDRLGSATVLGTVSHQHIYGLLFRVLWPLSAGRAFAPQRIVWPEELAGADTGPVVLVASPAHLRRLPAAVDWRRFAGSLRAVFSSGGPLPADAADDVRRLWGRAPVEVFGSTETGGIASRERTGEAATWTPLPGVEWRLADGGLQVRSPHLADADWYATSDRARAAGADGFELLGRADRVVKLEERRISLDAIERRLRESPWLQEVRVVVLPGARVLIAAVAVATPAGEDVLAHAGRAGLAAQLRGWLAGHVDPIALPRRWRFVPAMPADAQGKTGARALQALFQPRMPAPRWERRDPASAAARLHATPELAGFAGHFPGMPILPGVVLVDWAVRLARDAFAVDGEFAGMEALKFQQLVRPGTDLQAQLDWRPGTLTFRFSSDAGVHASGRLHFAGGEGA